MQGARAGARAEDATALSLGKGWAQRAQLTARPQRRRKRPQLSFLSNSSTNVDVDARCHSLALGQSVPKSMCPPREAQGPRSPHGGLPHTHLL